MPLKPHPAVYVAQGPEVRVTNNGFHFTAEAVRLADLNEMRWVSVFTDLSERRVAFKFSADPSKPRGHYKFSHGRKRGDDLMPGWCVTKRIHNSEPWIGKAARRYFPLDKHPDGLWSIMLAPVFERRIPPEDVVAKLGDAEGIYRYVNDAGDVVYIGRGRIRDRYREPQRRDWPIAYIEYSVVEGVAEQEEWEAFHLDEHERKYGILPTFNKRRERSG